jgi:hypothetical protein
MNDIAVKKTYRHELKYYISNSEYLILSSRLASSLPADPFSDRKNQYHIRSLYFDDLSETAMREKLSGVEKRKKYRIRIYNKSDDIIKYEVKGKIGSYINKEIATLKREECNRILQNEIEFLYKSKINILKELYLNMKLQLLKPVVIVDYIREAYIYPVGNVRIISFDMQLSTPLNSIDIFDKHIPSVHTLDSSIVILEIKFNNILPELIKYLLQIDIKQRDAISKYLICRQYPNIIN